MTSPHASLRIACPINLVESYEREIEQLTAAINHASAPDEKGRLARELLDNVSTLLDCNAYDQNNPACHICRDLSTLRQMTATVIDKAAALGR